MSTTTMSMTAAPADPFDLDIRVLEPLDQGAAPINLTHDGCGTTCPNACITNAG